MSVRPRSFSDFDIIWCVRRPRPNMHTSMTLSQSKVKVTVLLKLQKLHFSMSVSSTILDLSSKLVASHDTMGPNVRLVGTQFLKNFFLRKLNVTSLVGRFTYSLTCCLKKKTPLFFAIFNHFALHASHLSHRTV